VIAFDGGRDCCCVSVRTVCVRTVGDRGEFMSAEVLGEKGDEGRESLIISSFADL
jgi:hypothetical protein